MTSRVRRGSGPARAGMTTAVHASRVPGVAMRLHPGPAAAPINGALADAFAKARKD